MARPYGVISVVVGIGVCVFAQPALADPPVASCAWSSRADVQHMVGVRVRKGKYMESLGNGYRKATCTFTFTKQSKVPGSEGDVVVNYSQGHDVFLDVSGQQGPGGPADERTTVVHGLGACPPDMPNCPWTALITVEKRRDRLHGHLGRKYTDMIILGVRDGYKEFSIVITNYYIHLPVSTKHEIEAIERLGHVIAPKFAAVP